MKTGYAAGAVAGFIVGVAATIFGIPILDLYKGLSTPEILQLLPLTATVHIVFNTFWGVVWGVLFAKFYDVIPGKSGINKGLVFGLIYALVEWWVGSYALLYGRADQTLLWAVYGPVVILFYGLPLGYLYEGTQQPVKPEDTRKHKPVVSVLAGLVGGIVIAILTTARLNIGIPIFWTLLDIVPLITNFVAIEFILMTIWGIIFSFIFVLLYPRLPGKTVMKGVYYGLILFLLISVYESSVAATVMTYDPTFLQVLIINNVTYCLSFISYGLVLGYFYKKE